MPAGLLLRCWAAACRHTKAQPPFAHSAPPPPAILQVAAAEQLLERVKAEGGEGSRALVEQAVVAVAAYIDLAATPVAKVGGGDSVVLPPALPAPWHAASDGMLRSGACNMFWTNTLVVASCDAPITVSRAAHLTAALLAPQEAEQMAFPATVRRRLRDLTLVPVISVSWPVDPGCRCVCGGEGGGLQGERVFVCPLCVWGWCGVWKVQCSVLGPQSLHMRSQLACALWPRHQVQRIIMVGSACHSQNDCSRGHCSS